MQARADTVLYYEDKNLDIEMFYQIYSERAEWIGYKEDYKEQRGLIESAFSSTPIKKEEANDFKIFLIEGMCDDSGYCNHGSLLLVAIKEETKEVVHHASYW